MVFYPLDLSSQYGLEANYQFKLIFISKCGVLSATSIYSEANMLVYSPDLKFELY